MGFKFDSLGLNIGSGELEHLEFIQTLKGRVWGSIGCARVNPKPNPWILSGRVWAALGCARELSVLWLRKRPPFVFKMEARCFLREY